MKSARRVFWFAVLDLIVLFGGTYSNAYYWALERAAAVEWGDEPPSTNPPF